MKLEKVKSTGREKYILDACRNQKVLHLGCADWPFTKDRIVKNKLLHESIQNVAAHLSGVDLSSEGIQIMKDSGYKNIHLANSESSLFACS
jgi:predicted TPR repeat methyltransferase